MNHNLKKGLVCCTQRSPIERFTPLRVSVAEVFSKIDYKNLLPKPIRMRSAPGRRDKNRYYEYHREHGHDTNECRIIKSEIEKLIKKGYIKEFVDKDGSQDTPRQNHRSPNKDSRPRVKNEPLEAPQLAGQIDTITGA
ncbi:hypothetical protein LIER_40630 [Lithospermum erythrorhizon]|uniref:Reverse transcriptase domain-containing protein n=1 Tax=Lithospermum erythrorhizon TaxID=34254 RepID=A0AAV3QZM3_LITER